MIMACGTGKTLAALWIAERLDAQRTLVLVPSLSLLAQTLREWNANANEPFEYLAVCSDETVADQDDSVSHTSDLGLPVTTDPERDRRVPAPARAAGGLRDLPVLAPDRRRVTAAESPRFDLAIADEAHRCAGPVSAATSPRSSTPTRSGASGGCS